MKHDPELDEYYDRKGSHEVALRFPGARFVGQPVRDGFAPVQAEKGRKYGHVYRVNYGADPLILVRRG